MTVSNEVPASFKTRWSSNHVNAAQTSDAVVLTDTPNASSSPGPATRKLNKSCVNCRTARVKCSGGEPCRRCAGTSLLSGCSYSVSRRRGKRKAREFDDPGQSFVWNALPPLDHVALNDAFPDLPDGITEEVARIPHDQQHEADDFWVSMGISTGDMAATSTMMPVGLDLTGMLDSPKPSTQTPRPGDGPHHACPNSCFAGVHSSTNELLSLMTPLSALSFDLVLRALDLSVSRAAEYFACESCDSGCSRLMILSLHHQRQLDIMSKIARNEDAKFTNATPRVSFGIYTVSAEDTVAFKKVLLLRVSRDISVSLDDFQKRAQSFEDRYLEGSLKLGEAGQLNMKWLLGVASSLKRRIECSRLLLEKPDWGPS